MTDPGGFDLELQRFADTIKSALSEGKDEGYTPTLVLVYPEESLFLGLVAEEDAPETADTYELLHAFGRVQGRLHPKPKYVFAAIQSVWEDGSECIFLSGATFEGARNGARLSLARNAQKGIRVSGMSLFKATDARFEGRTCAGEFVRGFQAVIRKS
jgi:hypothetical protein